MKLLGCNFIDQATVRLPGGKFKLGKVPKTFAKTDIRFVEVDFDSFLGFS